MNFGSTPHRFRRRVALVIAAAGLGLAWAPALAPAGTAAGAQEQGASRREFSVAARRYAFDPDRIEVRQDDVVKISFRATDIPHSFTVDAYRISKRAGAGETVIFEFHARQAGTFPIYCNLATDEGCREMRGELVVRPTR